MRRDVPLLGCGFGRYYDLKMPYLSDRSQQLELESLRNLDHHNTLLSIMVETGIFGISLFLALLVAWTRSAWQLYQADDLPTWERSHGLFQLAVLINYLSSALFHDLTLLPTEHWPLFLTAGVSAALLARRAASHARLRRVAVERLAHDSSRRRYLIASSRQDSSRHAMNARPQIALFGMSIDSLNMQESVTAILEWCRAPRERRCLYVVTPNVDHTVMFQTNPALRDAYAGAALVLADGAPVVWASRLLGRRLPERVAGSDLAPALLKRATADGQSLRVFLARRRARRRRASRRQHRASLAPGRSRRRSLAASGLRDERRGKSANLQRHRRRPTRPRAARTRCPQARALDSRPRRPDSSQGRIVRRRNDRLPGGRKEPCAPLDASLRTRVVSPPGHRTGRLAKRYLRDAWIFPQLVWQDRRGRETARS